MSKVRHNSGGKPLDFDKMSVFDRLPLPIRRALYGAPYSYNPLQVEQAWKRSGKSASAYADYMPVVFRRDMERKSSLQSTTLERAK